MNIINDNIKKMKRMTNSKYQWPASQLGATEMALLAKTRAKTKMPISKLLRLAVLIAYGAKTNELSN